MYSSRDDDVARESSPQYTCTWKVQNYCAFGKDFLLSRIRERRLLLS